MRFVPWFAFLTIGCGGEGGGGEIPLVCDAVVTASSPTDGAGPTARNIALELSFEGNVISEGDSDEPAVITMSDGDESIPGTVSVEGDTVRFVPEGTLPPETEILWTADVCDSTLSGSFTTGTLEDEVAEEDLEDSAYAIDLSEATWISPEGMGALIDMVFGGAFLIGIQAVTETEIDCISAAGEATQGGSWQQDPCTNTLDFDPMPFNNPYFSLQADELEFNVDGNLAILHGVTITGALTSDAIVDGTFSGDADLRDYEGIDCATLETYGLSCTECQSDGEVTCVWLEAVDVEGPIVPGLTVVPNEAPEECD